MEELHDLQREAHWDYDLVQPAIAPGSREEERALEEIDAARDDEERQLRDDAVSRQRRLSRYWRGQPPR